MQQSLRNRTRRERRLKASFDHGVCKRSVVVSVRDVPPKIPFSKWGTLIHKVYSLPKGKGLVTPTIHDHGMAVRRAFSIGQRGRAEGRPVCTRVRFTEENRVRGWRVYIFKKTDLTKRRNGREAN